MSIENAEFRNVVTLVGNPKPQSRTYLAAALVAERLTGRAPDRQIDLAEVGAELLDWQSSLVAELVEQVTAADLLIVASPTYKATYTGLLKLFLDRFAADSLANTVAIPLMLGGGPVHSLAPELHLRPLLVEIGASTPTRALYLIDRTYDDPAALDPWLATARPQLGLTVASAV